MNDIKDFLSEGQKVKVKVLTIGEDGKIGLSIKKAMPPQKKPSGNSGNNNSSYHGRNSAPRPASPRPGNFEWQSSKKVNLQALRICFPDSSRQVMRRCLI